MLAEKDGPGIARPGPASTRTSPAGERARERARRKVIIVAPHFPPSNLAAVHRSRLLAQHLPKFGWDPIIVTVDHRHYEEQLDWGLAALLPEWLQIERVAALPTKPLRLVGDIGVRGWFPMLRRILHIIDTQQVDFLYVTIPSNYAALLGRAVHALRGLPYGIDYIDPWVERAPPGARAFSKAWLTHRLATILEPVSVRRAALISGVAERYYEDVLARNPHLRRQSVTVAMPYGGEPADHRQMRDLNLRQHLFPAESGVTRLVYAGAMLPQATATLEAVLGAIASDRASFNDLRLHFIGTGASPDDPEGHKVRPLAERYGLWQSLVFEHPARIPYLEVLAHLDAADGVFLLGSTERHYTPSKVFQSVLSGKPVFAILHRESTACDVITKTGAGVVLDFDGKTDVEKIRRSFVSAFREFRSFMERFDPERVDMRAFGPYTAVASAEMLARALDRAITRERHV